MTAAELAGANLTGANITGAIFREANVNSARLIDLIGEAEAIDLDKTYGMNRAWRK
jgi:uncharacterized protein YjbI with pentapeptide repeats